MQILVVASFKPFDHTQTRTLGPRLVDELRAQKVHAELTMLPIQPDSTRQDEHRLAARLLDVVAGCDRLICVGSLAAFMRHPDKRVWLIDDDDPGTEDLASAASLREAAVVRAASARSEELARRAGVPVERLPIPADTDSWATVLAALAT